MQGLNLPTAAIRWILSLINGEDQAMYDEQDLVELTRSGEVLPPEMADCDPSENRMDNPVFNGSKVIDRLQE